MQQLIKLKLNIIVIGLMLISGQQLQAESLQLPPPYLAEYKLLKNGIPVANANFVLKYDEQRIHFSSVSKVSGLAAMFRKVSKSTGKPKLPKQLMRVNRRIPKLPNHCGIGFQSSFRSYTPPVAATRHSSSRSSIKVS